MKIFFLSVFFVLINSVILQAKDLYPGQTVFGSIKFGLNTTVNLPPGEWNVAGVAKKNGGIRPVDLILLQSIDGKIKAVFHIRYARDKGKSQGWDYVSGWIPDETMKNNTCDDYDDQKSNYHYQKIDKKKQNLIIQGSCMAVYALNDIYNFNELALDNSIHEAFEMTESYIQNKNLSYPNAMVFIDNTYFIEENYVQTYFAVNPELKNIETRSDVYFTDSNWHKYNINKHPEKKSFMNDAIFIGQQVFDDNAKAFNMRRALDFYRYESLY
tara:strand:- start:1326 stop:2135 length:810 start_codon:yes stop_codon:yes gene_type:complete